jgi:anti-sigma factor RsiW
MRLRLPARRELVCQQAVELVTNYLEGALPPAARRRFERHLAGCEHCTEYLAQIRATIAVAGRIGPEDLTIEMRAAFSVLYQSWRREEGGD